MNTNAVLIAGIVFIIVGLVFAVLGFFLKTTSVSPKGATSKIAGFLFYVIGAITLIMGIFAVVLHNDISKSLVQLSALIYLIFIAVCCGVFVTLVSSKTQEGADHGKDN